jgi:3-oxoacyl-[acyl-carrier-protein] synthase II
VLRPVITGVAAVTPLGRNVYATRDALEAGRSAIAPVDDLVGATNGKAASPAARIGAFTTEPELPKARARRLDKGSQYAVVAARQCFADAGFDATGREERVGILLATGSAGAGPLIEFERQLVMESPETASAFLFPYTVANAPASQAALELKLKGPNVTMIHKDIGALDTLLYARMMLSDARADALLVGAADEWALEYHQGYEVVHATRSASRGGYALGEGAAVVLLETEASASARGARGFARLAGVVQRARPLSPHVRRADTAVLVETVRAALEDAGVEPDDVGLVHLAANGTTWMDEAERLALSEVFGAHEPRRLAIKQQIGENPAMGAAQIALGALALREDPALRAVLLDGFSAGGNYMAAVLTRA